MSSLNRAIIIGNVGKDPEIRVLQNGGKVANFTVATSERWKDKQSGEKKERTEWHRVVVFNEHLVKVVESYVKKGSKLYLEGQIETRKWEKDGVEKYSTEIVLRPFNGEIVLLDSRSQEAPKQDAEETPAPQGGGVPDDMSDEIPFAPMA